MSSDIVSVSDEESYFLPFVSFFVDCKTIIWNMNHFSNQKALDLLWNALAQTHTSRPIFHQIGLACNAATLHVTAQPAVSCMWNKIICTKARKISSQKNFFCFIYMQRKHSRLLIVVVYFVNFAMYDNHPEAITTNAPGNFSSSTYDLLLCHRFSDYKRDIFNKSRGASPFFLLLQVTVFKTPQMSSLPRA